MGDGVSDKLKKHKAKEYLYVVYTPGKKREGGRWGRGDGVDVLVHVYSIEITLLDVLLEESLELRVLRENKGKGKVQKGEGEERQRHCSHQEGTFFFFFCLELTHTHKNQFVFFLVCGVCVCAHRAVWLMRH